MQTDLSENLSFKKRNIIQHYPTISNGWLIDIMWMKEGQDMEQFKRINGFEDYYISSWGRVYSTKVGKFLNPFLCGRGYLKVDLHINGKRTHKKVHRLVAEAFIPNVDHKPQVNHIDGNKLNNSVTNLEWCTNQENVQHYKDSIKLIRQNEIQGVI